MVARVAGVALLVIAILACGRGGSHRTATGAVDSALPRAQALARFRRDLPAVSALEGGATSRDELVRHFIAALERRDTSALRSLTLTRSEFAYLYYPTTPQGLPPYDLAPDLMWFMLVEHGTKGGSHALQERGGHELRLLGHRCEGNPSREGENTLWGPCLVLRLGERDDTIAERLFGLIMERGGRFKFVNYANNLD